MFDKLDDLVLRYEEIMNLLSEPDVAADTRRFRDLMKEQSDLAPIVNAYKEYKKCRQDIDDSLAMLEEETMRRCGRWSRRNSPRRESGWRSWSGN